MTTETQPIQLHQTPGNTSLPSKLTPQLPVTPPSTPMWWDKPKSQAPTTSRLTRSTTSTPVSDSTQADPQSQLQPPLPETPPAWPSRSTVPLQLSLDSVPLLPPSLLPCSEEFYQNMTHCFVAHEKNRRRSGLIWRWGMPETRIVRFKTISVYVVMMRTRTDSSSHFCIKSF